MALELGFVTQVGMHYTGALPVAAAADLDHVELMLDGDHERAAIDPDAVATAADEEGVDCLVHLPFAFDPCSPYEHVREGALRELDATMETASAFDARKAVVHATSNAWGPAWDDDAVADGIVETLAELDDVATDHGIELCVENIPGDRFGLDEFPRLFDETDVSMTLDTGHAYVEGYDATEQAAFIAEHADRVSHVHINDVRKRADEHVPVGAGVLDFERICAPLETATLSVEVFTHSFDYVEESVERLRDAVEGSD